MKDIQFWLDLVEESKPAEEVPSEPKVSKTAKRRAKKAQQGIFLFQLDITSITKNEKSRIVSKLPSKSPKLGFWLVREVQSN